MYSMHMISKIKITNHTCIVKPSIIHALLLFRNINVLGNVLLYD